MDIGGEALRWAGWCATVAAASRLSLACDCPPTEIAFLSIDLVLLRYLRRLSGDELGYGLSAEQAVAAPTCQQDLHLLAQQWQR